MVLVPRSQRQSGFLPGYWPVWGLLCLLIGTVVLSAQEKNPAPTDFIGYPAAGNTTAVVKLPLPTDRDPIYITCDYLHEEASEEIGVSDILAGSATNAGFDRAKEQQGRVILLRGRCRIRQGRGELTARQMVIWRSEIQEQGRVVDRLLVYPEGDIKLSPHLGQKETGSPFFVELMTTIGVTVEARHPSSHYVSQTAMDPLHLKADQARQRLQQTAMVQPQLLPPNSPSPQLLGPEIDFDSLAPAPRNVPDRRIIISPRSLGVAFRLESFLSEQTSPPEQVTVISQGVNIVIEGIEEFQGMRGGTLDLSADQIVMWTQADSSGKFRAEMFQDADAPLQIYLEGNIEIRQDDKVLRASRAYYDIKESRAILLDGELKVNIPSLSGDIKLRAQRIRQLNKDSFHAENAWVTGSEFGVPNYRLEAGDIFLENRYDKGWLGTGNSAIDPQTGLPVRESTPWITSLNNRFRVGETPVFVSPFLSGPASDPQVPLESLTLGGDSILGAQVKSTWNMTKLLGLESPPGLDWNLQLNGYSERGVWLGTDATYEGAAPFYQPGSFFGETEAVWINDFGEDNLGRDRRSLDVPSNTRGRVLWRHRQYLEHNFSLTAEVGLLSDRNFLEQYYENEWDRGKDNETLLGLNYQKDNLAASLMTRFQVNDFEYDTQWLPKGDLTILGEPLLWDRLVYSSRSTAGYGELRPGKAPDDPNDLFVPLWYAPEASGAVLSSRHELSMPFNLGPVKFDPYIMGEAAYWQDDGFTNSSLSRLYGSAGLRGNMMLWKVYPQVRSQILGLNGLAHKQVIGFDYSFSDSSEDLQNVPQYNEFDENAQERFRTRLIFNSFGLMNSALLPAQYDPRFYAVRSGAARNVTSPYFELVDDQEVLRLNWNHRLQTKVGPPERQRVKDWMTLDLGISYFPDPGEDNFGESFGLLTANYIWDVGARTKLLANGQFDFFDDAPQVWDVGLLNQRGKRGSVYVGYRNLQAGPLESQLLNGSVSYAMSEKWLATLGTAYDIAENEDRGQSLTITSIRADVLIHVGLSVDSSKGNVGLGFMLEPRLGGMGSSNHRMDSLLQAQ